ncbi:MAG TPA: DUF2779 domain-containing protein [Gammaproteobacteria bacterium]|nr:DUF2779 domain-containing protein [Gammaproteobacteria bacterium]
MRGLSKSRILAGLQCPKRLYLETFHKELAAIREQAQRLFDIGHEVGPVARRLHPDGILLHHQDDLSRAVEETRQLLAQESPVPLFEATFSQDGVLVRVDVLEKNTSGLVLTEVKAAASVKPQYYPDCAIQAWVVQRAGYQLASVNLAHVDSSFVYRREGDYAGLLHTVDVSEEVHDLVPRVRDWISTCQQTLEGDLPDVDVGPQCKTPYECPFYHHCNAAETEYPVTTLPWGGKVVEKLLEEGIVDIRDVPPGRLTNERHVRIREVVLSGEPFLDPEARSIVRTLSYPRYYLDFETIAFAVPIWLGTRPYQQLPFQWSCHIETTPGDIQHREFLDVTGNSPMRHFAESLIEGLGVSGPVIVYNAAFEKRIIRGLAQMLADLAPALEAIIDRVFDLLPVARNHYYHPAMQGSWSIKSVLPTIAPDLDYQRLEGVQHGGEAQEAYLECIHPETSSERKLELERHLTEYCALDTLAMVRIAHYFESDVE